MVFEAIDGSCRELNDETGKSYQQCSVANDL